MVTPPCIPDCFSCREEIKLFLICHEVHFLYSLVALQIRLAVFSYAPLRWRN